VANNAAFTNIVTAATAAVDTNTTQVATTAYVIGQASSATPTAIGATGAAGVGTRWARSDHTHAGVSTLSTSGTGISVNTTVGSITLTSNANTANSASTLVARDSAGNFAANTITATLSGAATSATTATTAGTVTTAAQGNITSVGTLTSLAVTGNITSGNLQGTSIVGTLTTGAQTNITSVGTLTALAVTGNITSGNLQGTSIVGTLTTAAQTNITSVGTLTALAVSGNASSGTAAADTNTTQLATTAFVVGQASAATPTSIGTNTIGTSLRYARADHTHTGVASLANGGGITASVSTGAVTLGSTATNANTASAIVARDASGNFSAGTITATLSGAATSAGTATTAGTVTTAAQPNITSVGTLTLLTVSGALSSGAHTITGSPLAAIINGGTNGVGNIGSAAGTFNTVFAKATTAQYADLAENYAADAGYEPGTVVEFGGNAEVTISNQSGSTRIAGVVSTQPAYLMNSHMEAEHVAAVALMGRVPVKVIGPVRKGDMMVSDGAGRAKSATRPEMGSVIGKALENFDGAYGMIEVVIGKL